MKQFSFSEKRMLLYYGILVSGFFAALWFFDAYVIAQEQQNPAKTSITTQREMPPERKMPERLIFTGDPTSIHPPFSSPWWKTQEVIAPQEAGLKVYYNFSPKCSEYIASAEFDKDSGTITVQRRRTCQPVISNPGFFYGNTLVLESSPSVSVSVWKEVYGAKDGRIILLYRQEAKVIPPQPEKIEW